MRPCGGWARSTAKTPACVISASTASAATTIMTVIESFRTILGT